MRILHLRNTCGFYGAERCITSWIAELSPRGFAFDVAYFDHPDPSVATFAAAARGAGANAVESLPRAHASLPRVLSSLVRRVRHRGVDLIHAHETRSHAVGWVVGGLTATPVVATVHGYVVTRTRSRRMNDLNRSFLGGRRFAALTVPTRALAELWPRDAVVVPNGVPAAPDTPAHSRPDVPTFGVVARLSREKGVDVFLDAVAALPDDWRFEVIGEGPEAAALRSHRAGDRVRWLGFQADASDRMRAWTALVLPSRSEGLPLSLLEAMGREVPVIATDVGGVPDAITSGSDGLLVDPENPSALASAIRAVVEDPAAAGERAARAKTRFEAEYRIDRVGDRLAELYGSVASREARS